MNNETELEKWHDVVRVAHLSGGGRATNPPGPQVSIYPTPQAKSVEIQLRTYRSLMDVLDGLHLPVIGIEYYLDQDQIDGLYPSEWRPFDRAFEGGWPVTESIRRWADLSNAGVENDDFAFMDVCRRINVELSACSLKLLDLSEAYHRELQSLCRRGDYAEGGRFATANTAFVTARIHAFFSEVGTLRDYLAEFVFRFVLNDIVSAGNLRTMAGLRRVLVQAEIDHHPLVARILEITDERQPGGWMAILSAYRNLVVHCVPISQVSHKGLILSYCRMKLASTCMPAVAFLLPRDPFASMRLHNQEAPFENIKEWMQASLKAILESDGLDALDYAHKVLVQIARLAIEIATFSPHPPKRRHLTEADLRRPVSSLRDSAIPK